LKGKEEKNFLKNIRLNMFIVIQQDNYVLKTVSLKNIHLQHNSMLGIFGRKDIQEIQ